jgi:hypothetical protein
LLQIDEKRGHKIYLLGKVKKFKDNIFSSKIHIDVVLIWIKTKREMLTSASIVTKTTLWNL